MSVLYRTWATPEWREHGAANVILLEDGVGRLLFEDGFTMTLEDRPAAYRSRIETQPWEHSGVTPPWRDLDLAARPSLLRAEDGSILTLEDGSGHIVVEGP